MIGDRMCDCQTKFASLLGINGLSFHWQMYKKNTWNPFFVNFGMGNIILVEMQ